MLNVYKLNKAQTKLTAAKKSDDNKKEVAKYSADRHKAIMGVIKNGIDLMIPASRLDIVSIEDGYVGLLGTVTTFIGGWDQWKKVNH